jgi:hypothetical protein
VLTILTSRAAFAAKWIVIAATILAGSALAAASVASAQTVAAVPKPGIEALFSALGQGDWVAADAIAASLDAASEDKSLFSTFVRATQSVAKGDCASGGPLAENVVSRSPLFLPAYDLIGKCLVEAGEPEKAAVLFENVASRLNPGADRNQILARAQSLRPDLSPRYSVDVNVQPSTNVNRGTDNTTIDGWTISDSARTKAGVTAGAFGTMDKPLHVSRRLISSVSLKAGASYNTVSEDVFPTARLALNTRYLLSAQTSLGASLAYAHVLKGTQFESASPSLAVDVSHQVNPALTLGARAELAYTHHNNDGHTGWTANLSSNAGITVSANDRVNVVASYVLEARKADTQSYQQIGVSSEWEHAFANGFIGSLGGEVSYRLYQSNAPATDEQQYNVQTRTTIGVSHRDLMIGKFRPELAYTFTKQWSNDAFSDFEAHDVGVKAKAAF